MQIFIKISNINTFFSQGFLSRTITIDRTAGEGGGYLKSILKMISLLLICNHIVYINLSLIEVFKVYAKHTKSPIVNFTFENNEATFYNEQDTKATEF